MKRLSILFVGLLSAVLIFSVVGLADEGVKTTSTVTFDSWIDLNITNGIDDLTVRQNGTEGGNEFVLRGKNTSVGSLGSITVEVSSLFDYTIGASYYAPNEDNDLISLNGRSGYIDSNIAYYNHTSAFGGSNTYDEILNPSNAATNITEIGDFDKTIGNPDSWIYDVGIDFSNLNDEYTNNETLDVEVAFWAYETTV